MARKNTGKPAVGESAARQRGGRGQWVLYGLVAAIALGCRLIHLSESRAVPFFECLIGDAATYDAWAHRIAGGEWLGDSVFYQAPLYPYFLAVLHVALGHDLWWIRVPQAVLGAGGCVLLALAGTRYFSRSAGVIAGLLLAVYPPAIFFDGLIQKAALDGFFMAVLLCLLGGHAERPRWWLAVVAGLTLGLLCLTRENALVLAPIAGLWLLVERRLGRFGSRARGVALFAAGVATPLLLVGARNAVVGGEFLVTTSQFGPNFYIGNNPQAIGIYRPLRAGRSMPEFERLDATEIAESAEGRSLTPREVSAYWFSRSLEFIRGEPLAWLRLMGRKLAFVFNSYEVPDAEDQYYYELSCPLIRRHGRLLHFGVLAPAAAAGIVLTWPRRRELWLLYALLAAMALGTALFYVFARYRHSLVPVLILLAGAALPALIAGVRAGAWRRLVIAGGATMLAAIGANWPTFNAAAQRPVAHANAGSALDNCGRLAEAAKEFQRALELSPRDAYIRANYAIVLAKLGRGEAAGGEFAEALRLSPGDAELARRLEDVLAPQRERVCAAPRDVTARLELAAILVAVGRAADAIAELDAAAEVDASHVGVLNNLAILYLQQNRWGDAILVMRRVETLAPREVGIVGNLAWSLAVCPEAELRDPAKAVELARRLVELAGEENPRVLDTLAAALASAGQFEEAASTAERAAQAAERFDAAEYADQIRARADGYRRGVPYVLPK